MTNGTFKIGVTEKHQAGLTIEKQLQDIHGVSISDESKQEFKFKIRLMNADNIPLEGDYSYKKSPVSAALDKDNGEGKISITISRLKYPCGPDKNLPFWDFPMVPIR